MLHGMRSWHRPTRHDMSPWHIAMTYPPLDTVITYIEVLGFNLGTMTYIHDIRLHGTPSWDTSKLHDIPPCHTFHGIPSWHTSNLHDIPPWHVTMTYPPLDALMTYFRHGISQWDSLTTFVIMRYSDDILRKNVTMWYTMGYNHEIHWHTQLDTSTL